MKKALIVDDAVIMRQHIKTNLSGLGEYDILEAGNGKEALEKFKEFRPDIVTMDINMPEKNGVETVKEIKKLDPSAKIIMITSKNDEENLLDAINAGADGYILKPIHKEKLQKVLNTLK